MRRKFYNNTGLNELYIPIDNDILNCTSNNITKLVLHNNLYKLFCYDNNIKLLTLNNKLELLFCDIFVNVKNIDNKELRITFL